MKKKTLQRVRAFTTDRDWDQYHTPANLAKTIIIEAGELLECFQWNDDYKIEKVKEELDKCSTCDMNCVVKDGLSKASKAQLKNKTGEEIVTEDIKKQKLG